MGTLLWDHPIWSWMCYTYHCVMTTCWWVLAAIQFWMLVFLSSFYECKDYLKLPELSRTNENLFTYVTCSICLPRQSTHFISCFNLFVQIQLNILDWAVAQQSLILYLRWQRSWMLTAFTCVLENPQNANSTELWSGDHNVIFNLKIRQNIITIPIGSRHFGHPRNTDFTCCLT